MSNFKVTKAHTVELAKHFQDPDVLEEITDDLMKEQGFKVLWVWKGSMNEVKKILHDADLETAQTQIQEITIKKWIKSEPVEGVMTSVTETRDSAVIQFGADKRGLHKAVEAIEAAEATNDKVQLKSIPYLARRKALFQDEERVKVSDSLVNSAQKKDEMAACQVKVRFDGSYKNGEVMTIDKNVQSKRKEQWELKLI